MLSQNRKQLLALLLSLLLSSFFPALLLSGCTNEDAQSRSGASQSGTAQSGEETQSGQN